MDRSTSFLLYHREVNCDNYNLPSLLSLLSEIFLVARLWLWKRLWPHSVFGAVSASDHGHICKQFLMLSFLDYNHLLGRMCRQLPQQLHILVLALVNLLLKIATMIVVCSWAAYWFMIIHLVATSHFLNHKYRHHLCLPRQSSLLFLLSWQYRRPCLKVDEQLNVL